MSKSTPFLRRWCEDKLIDPERLLANKNVSYDPQWGGLTFKYTHPTYGAQHRLYLLAEYDNDPTSNYKVWRKGAHARGSVLVVRQKHLNNSYHVCEGETDAIAMSQHDDSATNIVAIPGANTIDRDTVRAFPDTACIYIWLDQDDAGNRGARKLCNLLDKPGQIVYRVSWDVGKDVRDFYKVTDAELSYERMFPEAEHHQYGNLSMSRYSHTHYSYKDHARNLPGKPDLRAVWMKVCKKPPHPKERSDGQGRSVLDAFCPIHENLNTPSAWLGENRWGCWACDVEGDVYDLVAWVKGYTPVGTKTTGRVFTLVRQEARKLG